MKVTIDNRTVEVPAGTTVLDAARQVGIEIPTLCHLPGRPAEASCFLCTVRVRGMNRLVPSCGTPAADGMVVESETPEVLEARRTAIELLLSDHLGDCIGPCQGVCPAHMDIPRMIRLIAAGRDRDALITVKEAIALPAVLGRICPELCEKGCRRAVHDGSISICMLKRYVADTDLASDMPFMPACSPPSGNRVAIVGTGPAGLSAAYYLLLRGHACTLFDDHEKPGGMLRYGVSEEVLPRDVLDAEIDVIRRMGAEFRCGVRICRDLSVQELQDGFDAVLLAVGDVRSEHAAAGFGVEFGSQGVRVDKQNMMASVEGVFAAGGALIASRHAIRSLADGRSAADAIHRFLSGKGNAGEKEFSCHVGRLDTDEVQPFLTRGTPEPRVAPSGGTAEGFTQEEAHREALRCLRCDCEHADGCALRQVAMRMEANPLRYKSDRREYVRDESHPLLVFESGKCIACGICVRLAAEAGEELGLAFTGRGISIRLDVPFRHLMSDGLQKAARACAEACPTQALTIRSE